LLLAVEGDFSAAEPIVVEAYEWLCGEVGADDPRAREAGLRVIDLYDRWERPDDAQVYRRRLRDAEAAGENDAGQ
jgi:hypothetical protein